MFKSRRYLVDGASLGGRGGDRARETSDGKEGRTGAQAEGGGRLRGEAGGRQDTGETQTSKKCVREEERGAVKGTQTRRKDGEKKGEEEVWD